MSKLPEGKSQFYLANKWRRSNLTVEEKREMQPRVAGSSGRLADGVSFQLVWQLERMHTKIDLLQMLFPPKKKV
jgi:homospermidine synthase